MFQQDIQPPREKQVEIYLYKMSFLPNNLFFFKTRVDPWSFEGPSSAIGTQQAGSFGVAALHISIVYLYFSFRASALHLFLFVFIRQILRKVSQAAIADKWKGVCLNQVRRRKTEKCFFCDPRRGK